MTDIYPEEKYIPMEEELNDAITSIKAALTLLDHAGDQLDLIVGELVKIHGEDDGMFIIKQAVDAERALAYFKNNVMSLLYYQTATQVPKLPIRLEKFRPLFKL